MNRLKLDMLKKDRQELGLETVLVMQGGGSLGAYECGVYKTLTKHNIKFDIVAGTSIGAVNAAIIAAHHDDKDSAKELEKFWLDIAEIIMPIPSSYSPFFSDETRAIMSSASSALYGNPKAFMPLWFKPSSSYLSYRLPYPLFDIAPLKNTLNNYVDFTKLKDSGRTRLIMTSTDIQTSNTVVFDSKYVNIDVDHVVASVGFPFYGIAWTKKDGKCLWDGALQSNTPLREVIDSSPIHDKIVYLINIFPRYQKELPQDMFEAWHRARDIIYTDKTDNSIRMSKVISRYLFLLREMHELLMIRNSEYHDAKLENRFQRMEHEYTKLALLRGAIIREIVRIERSEKTHFLFEDADFSVVTTRKLIKQGEEDAERALKIKSSND